MSAETGAVILLNQNLSGGLGNDLVNWSRLYAESGLRVTVVIWKDEGQFRERLPGGVTKIVLGTGSFLRATLRLARILRAQPNATVLATQYKAGASAVLARDLARTRQRLVYREPVLPGSYLNAYTIFRYYRLCLVRADAVLAQTGHAARELAALGFQPDRIRICPNLPPDGATAPSPPGVGPADHPRLIAVGRLTEQKGFDRLIRHFPSVVANHPGATLTLVGDGALRAKLEALAAESPASTRIRFTGQVADPTPYLRDADLFVMSSEYEGLSNAFVEALFSGCRAITTPAGGGMADFMRDLGAADCIIDDANFASDLPRAVSHALSKTEAQWAPVFRRLDEAYGHDAVRRIFLDAVRPPTAP